MVSDQPVIDDVGQVSLERAVGLFAALAFGDLPPVVVLAGPGPVRLAERDHVQCGVELAVAGSADAAFPGRIAALVRGPGQAHEGTDLPAILERPPRKLPGIGLGADLGDATQSLQTPGNFRGTVLTLPDPSIPLTLELQKLAMDDTVTSDLRCARR